jgi:hypothetical protein
MHYCGFGRYYRTQKSRRALKGNECAAYFENDEKQQRAAELSLANTELAFQNEQKEKRAAELINANNELLFKIKKSKRAAELIAKEKAELYLEMPGSALYLWMKR